MAEQASLSMDMMGNPIWVDNNQADPWTVPDQSVDVPGRDNTNQTAFERMFAPYVDANSRDASQTPEITPATKDAGATGPGILSRMWNAMAHPLQTIEDTGAAAGNAAGAAVGNSVEKILKGISAGIMPIVIILIAGIVLLAFAAGNSGLLRARVSA